MVDYNKLMAEQDAKMRDPNSSFLKHAAGKGAQPKLFGKGDSHRSRRLAKGRMLGVKLPRRRKGSYAGPRI